MCMNIDQKYPPGSAPSMAMAYSGLAWWQPGKRSWNSDSLGPGQFGLIPFQAWISPQDPGLRMEDGDERKPH